MPKYNGHRSWNAWNVALWIGNDENLYRLALKCKSSTNNLHKAAELFLSYVPSETPDGAKYNLTCVKEALRDLD
jgi:hypothetical protein